MHVTVRGSYAEAKSTRMDSDDRKIGGPFDCISTWEKKDLRNEESVAQTGTAEGLPVFINTFLND